MRARFPLMLIVAAVLAWFSPTRAQAAPEGQYWYVTPMGGWGVFSEKLIYPDSSQTKDNFLVGGRIGWQWHPMWALEFSGAYSPTKEDGGNEEDITYLDLAGNLVFTPVRWPAGEPYISAGGGWAQRNSKDAPDDLHYGTFELAAGWQSWFTDHVGLRLEARNVLNIPQKNWGSANKSDQQYWAGLAFGWGGKLKDTDGDGVPDKKDKCPDTPTGAKVDLTGCPTDADGDGVFDGLDTCPGTPKGASVDAKGCPKDSDGDGVFDGLDKCADTPKGAKVDASGCTTDSDGDGVADGLDQCANTARGATVDANGCPKDSDGDGIADGLDKCPGTTAGLKVDADGCPIEITERETQLLDTGMIRLQGVNFETGKSDILPESYAILDEVGTILRKWPQLKVEVGGHTDSRGAAAANQSLSEARANAVRTYLIEKFTDINGEQLSAKGYGEAKPIAPNNTALNLAKNRRVEFVVLNKDVLKMEVEKRKMLQK